MPNFPISVLSSLEIFLSRWDSFCELNISKGIKVTNAKSHCTLYPINANRFDIRMIKTPQNMQTRFDYKQHMEESTNRKTENVDSAFTNERGPTRMWFIFHFSVSQSHRIKLLFIVCWEVYGSLCSGEDSSSHAALEGCILKTILRSKLGLFEPSLMDAD